MGICRHVTIHLIVSVRYFKDRSGAFLKVIVLDIIIIFLF
jgi:hypothetical protein